MKKHYLLSLIIVLIAVFSINVVNNSKPEKAYLTFTFDDGYKSIYTEVLPIFKKYNLRGTVYVITNLTGKEFENEKLMNWSEINELQEYGFEIGCHSANHIDLTDLNEKEIRSELRISKEKLLEEGILVKSLAIPYGKYNEKIKNIAKEYYSSVRASVWGYNDLSNIDKYNLKSKWITNETKVSTIKSWIDEAVEEKKWVILMFHKIGEEDSLYSISPNKFEEIIKYMKLKKIEIKTISEIVDLYG